MFLFQDTHCICILGSGLDSKLMSVPKLCCVHDRTGMVASQVILIG
jgi:hypothetical protein